MIHVPPQHPHHHVPKIVTAVIERLLFRSTHVSKAEDVIWTTFGIYAQLIVHINAIHVNVIDQVAPGNNVHTEYVYNVVPV